MSIDLWHKNLEYVKDIHNLKNSKFGKLSLGAKDKNERAIEIGKFSNCLIAGENKHYPSTLLYDTIRNKLFSPIDEKVMSLNSSSPHNESDKSFNTDKICDKVVRQPVFFFSYNVDNYFHFVYDTLPYLFHYFHLKKYIPELKLLTNYSGPFINRHYNFVEECLGLLDIKKSDILICDTNSIYSEIYIGSSLTHGGLSNSPPRKEIFEVYKKLTDKCKNTENKSYDKIYISRRTWVNGKSKDIGTDYTNRRVCINEDEIAKKYIDKGYKEIFCENLSMKEKIKMFRNASFIAGTIGGGFVNLLFSDSNVKVQCIDSPGFFKVNNRFKYSISHTDISHFNNTSFTDDDTFKVNTRVKFFKDDKIFLGEVEKKCKNDFYMIRYLDRGVAGWNSSDNFNYCILHKDKMEPIGFGLNSPWKVDMEMFEKFAEDK